jgi:hypothetical protein
MKNKTTLQAFDELHQALKELKNQILNTEPIKTIWRKLRK